MTISSSSSSHTISSNERSRSSVSETAPAVRLQSHKNVTYSGLPRRMYSSAAACKSPAMSRHHYLGRHQPANQNGSKTNRPLWPVPPSVSPVPIGAAERPPSPAALASGCGTPPVPRSPQGRPVTCPFGTALRASAVLEPNLHDRRMHDNFQTLALLRDWQY